MMRTPVLGDADPSGDPDFFMRLDIIEKPREGCQAAMQAGIHHRRPPVDVLIIQCVKRSPPIHEDVDAIAAGIRDSWSCSQCSA